MFFNDEYDGDRDVTVTIMERDTMIRRLGGGILLTRRLKGTIQSLHMPIALTIQLY